MIVYKSNMAGPYHVESGLPCQDSFAIHQDENYSVLAVTDGLGSELYSDVGASVAAQTAVAYCSEHLMVGMQFDDIKKVMNNALVTAYKAVLTRAAEENNDSNEYDTTICLAVYDGEHLYYAQAGDSGLVALLETGDYYRVTTQQRDEELRVFPLCWGPEKWEFGCVDSPVSAFMLMTDGVFEQICPPLMRESDIDVNVPLARRFLDRFDCTQDDVPELEKAVRKYLEHYPRHLLDDDKTVVVLINSARKPKEKEEAYYAIPDWKLLRENAEKKLLEDSLESNEETSEECNEILPDSETLRDTACASSDITSGNPEGSTDSGFDDAEQNADTTSIEEKAAGFMDEVKKND